MDGTGSASISNAGYVSVVLALQVILPHTLSDFVKFRICIRQASGPRTREA
jgi:hypothetical protein